MLYSSETEVDASCRCENCQMDLWC